MGKYLQLVKRCVKAGLLIVTLNCESAVGIFFVKKTDGTIRLITDCRRTNECFLDPPSGLATGEGMANIECEGQASVSLDDDIGVSGDFGVTVGLADVSHCFHRCRLRCFQNCADIREYFCRPPVTAGDLDLTEAGGQMVGANTIVFPAASALPMGFAWSLYFAQDANLDRLRKLPSLRGAHLLSDRGSPWIIARPPEAKAGDLSARDTCCYVYVDNLGIASVNKELVTVVLDESQQSSTRTTRRRWASPGYSV